LNDTFLEQSLQVEIIDATENPIVSANVYQQQFPDWKDTHINDYLYSMYALEEVDEPTENIEKEDSGISADHSSSTM